MPYMLVGKCVYKKNPDGSRGENRGCSDTEEMAKAHMRALYAHEKTKEIADPEQREKAFAQALQPEGEAALDSQFLIEKDAQGKLRWALFTSSAFMDRDQQIVSTKALDQDCDQMEASGDYGELLWWHCDGLVHPKEKEARPYLPLGKADLSLVSDKINIESGTFYDEAVGAKLLSVSKELGASKAFYHPASEPVEGVFYHIRTKERSVLPRARESNFLTRLFGLVRLDTAKEKEMATNAERIKALKEKLGDDEAQKVIDAAKELSQEADQVLASKEQEPVKEPAPDHSAELTALKEAQGTLAQSIQALTEKATKAIEEVTALKTGLARTNQVLAALVDDQPKKAAKDLRADNLTRKEDLSAQEQELMADSEKASGEGYDSPMAAYADFIITGKPPAAKTVQG